ncbi:MAG: benzoate transporter BenE [Alphaproteobacteria bacterium]|nr:benzoate transporter BenE [Alphaproteobacteria bacterium]
MPPPVSAWPAILAGLVAALVGFGSAFAIVLQGLTGVGASPTEAASGLLAVTLAMGVLGILFGLVYRMPIAIAWSTPGAAMLAATGPIAGGFAAAVGAFLVCGAAIVVAGLWRPFGRAVLAIPAALANAMLAGVLLGLCVAPFRALVDIPVLAAPVVLAWIVAGRFARLYAAPTAAATAAVMVGLDLAGLLPGDPTTVLPGAGGLWTDPLWIAPTLSWSAIVGIGLPLFLVTMASQNIPGFAVLKANGYDPPSRPLLVGTGLGSIAGAPFGGHAVNLAAMTAALCAGPDAHPDPSRRWIASVSCGAAYVVLAGVAPLAAAFIAASPPLLIQAVAGLALIGAFGSAAAAFLAAAATRDAALVTFVATASGVSILGIGAAFWGLVAGGLVLVLHRIR